MNDAEMSELMTAVVAGVDGVERFYRPGVVGSALRALGSPRDPGVEVHGRPDCPEVVAHLGVDGSEPAVRTLVEAADALIAALDSAGVSDADVTVRVSRIL